MVNFIQNYKEQLKDLIDLIDENILRNIVNKIDKTESVAGNIYVLGNGGSASTASHMVNDLGVGLSRRAIKNLRIQSLSDNISVCTALANDVGYENIFLEQLKNKINSNDIIIAISCSGNSENILKAVMYAKEQGVDVISFTGFDGGELKNISDINLHVNTNKGKYGLVEDIHMIFNHMIYSYYINGAKEVI